MAIEQFKPTIWRARLLSNLKKAHVFGQVANRQFEGEISEAGDTVKLNSIGAISVRDYDGAVTYDGLSDSSISLTIDQEKYFAFKVDDVDEAQSNANQMDEAMEEASYSLADASDQFLADFYTDANITVTNATFNSGAVYETLAEVDRKLKEGNVPAQMPKWVVVSPLVYEKMQLAEITSSTDNISVLGDGAVTSTLGFDVYVSNNVTIGTSDEQNCMAGTYRGLAFAEQILDTEALRLEGSFADAVRGLYVYGGKVIRPAELAHVELTIASE